MKQITGVILASIAFIALETSVWASASQGSEHEATELIALSPRPIGNSKHMSSGAILLAQKAKKTKKSRKKSGVDEDAGNFGPDGLDVNGDYGDTGIGVHREQEGVDVPYKAEVAVDTVLSYLTTDVKGSSTEPVTTTSIDLGVEWLFVVGRLEVGPDVRVLSTNEATSVSGVNSAGQPSSETTETSTTGWSAGGLFKWNFASLDRSLTVPFAYGGVGYRASETKVGKAAGQKSSGMVLRAGGGLNLFLDSNVAFNPRVEFRMETDKKDGDASALETTTSGLRILLGVAVFI